MRQVRRGTRLRACLLALAAAAWCRADQVEYSAYYVWDEMENSVATTSFSMAKTFLQRTMALLDIQLDQVTVPPLAVVDGVSGASRPARHATREFRKSRGQIVAGVEQSLGEGTRLGGSYYFSQEIDYGSQAVKGVLSQDLFQKNLTVTLSGQYTADHVGEITQSGSITNRFKETHQGSLTLVQLLTPSTLMRVGGDGFRVRGFQSDPYQTSVHPLERWRQAAWAELRQYLPGLEGSLILNYRYYWDDWEMDSHTLRLRINKYLTQDLILSPWYRYYSQSDTWFASHPLTAEYHTSDLKMKAFESNTIGTEVAWYLRSLGRKRSSMDFLGSSSLHVLYFHYFRQSGPVRPSDEVLQVRLNFSY